jgi:hypothetical protein
MSPYDGYGHEAPARTGGYLTDHYLDLTASAAGASCHRCGQVFADVFVADATPCRGSQAVRAELLGAEARLQTTLEEGLDAVQRAVRAIDAGLRPDARAAAIRQFQQVTAAPFEDVPPALRSAALAYMILLLNVRPLPAADGARAALCREVKAFVLGALTGHRAAEPGRV